MMNDKDKYAEVIRMNDNLRLLLENKSKNIGNLREVCEVVETCVRNRVKTLMKKM